MPFEGIARYFESDPPGIYQLGLEIEPGKPKVEKITCAFIVQKLTMAQECEILELTLTKPIIFHGISSLGDVLQVNLPPYAPRYLMRLAEEAIYQLRVSEYEDVLFS